MKGLLEHVIGAGAAPGAARVVAAVAGAAREVAHLLHDASAQAASGQNASGDCQLRLDLQADEIFTRHLRQCGQVCAVASEEKPLPEPLTEGGDYAVCFDPLDGSSLVSANLSLGAIFGVFAGGSFVGQRGRQMVCAGYAVFGPRLEIVVALPTVAMRFYQNSSGEFVLSDASLCLKETGMYFAPGNLRAARARPDYAAWHQAMVQSGRTLRYSGGMVPDIHHILAKRGGIFTYPGTPQKPDGKLRLLFEAAPMAFVMRAANGHGTDDRGQDLLDKEITDIHQASSVLLGSRGDVQEALGYLRGEE